MKAILLCGISGSGKSTFCDKYSEQKDWLVIGSDIFRKRLVSYDKSRSFWDQYKFDKKLEKKITQLTQQYVQKAFDLKINVILDNTHLNIKTLERNIQMCKDIGYTDIEVVNLNKTTDINYYLNRNSKRLDRLKDQVINDQYVTAFKNSLTDLHSMLDNYPRTDVAVVDIDGTVAKFNNRSPFEYEKADTDLPRSYVIDVVKALLETNRIDQIIFLSGRDSSCYSITKQWLIDNGFDEKSFNLLMRKHGDDRKDCIVKDEIYQACIKPFYNVKYVFDDRNQMVDYWIDQGLPVFNVGDYRETF